MLKNVLMAVFVCSTIFLGGRELVRLQLEILFVKSIDEFNQFEKKRDIFFLMYVRANIAKTKYCILGSDPLALLQLHDIQTTAEEALRLVRVYDELQTMFHGNDVYLVAENKLLNKYAQKAQVSLSKLMYIKKQLYKKGVVEFCVAKDASMPV